MNTKLTRLLDIKYPIIQGAMAWVSDALLVSAVSNALAAGTLATGGRDGKWVREEIRKIKKLTNKPFGVNIMLQAHNCDEIVDIVCEEKVKFVTLGAGNPLKYFPILKRNNIKIIPVVPNAKLACRMADNKADAIILEGMEAGGHIGKITTMALMTQVIPLIDIPVIMAGGFVEGRSMAAALVMGASGIQMGTRFYASKECSAHINAKNLIIDAKDTDSVITGYLNNHMVRGIKNEMTDKYIQMEKNGATYEQLNKIVVGTSKKAPVEGDVKWGLVQAGQSLLNIKTIKTCENIVKETIDEAIETIKKIKIDV